MAPEPTHPFRMLERLLATADDEVARMLMIFGKQMIDDDAKRKEEYHQHNPWFAKKRTLQDYARERCAKADAALQDRAGNHLDFLYTLGITDLHGLWMYRQRLGTLCGHTPAERHAWLETDDPEPMLASRLVNEAQQDAPRGTIIEGAVLKADNPPSPLELCAALEFGYAMRDNREVLDIMREIICLGPGRLAADDLMRESCLVARAAAHDERTRQRYEDYRLFLWQAYGFQDA